MAAWGAYCPPMSAVETPEPAPAQAAPRQEAARLDAVLASMAQAEDAVARAVRQMGDNAGTPQAPDAHGGASS